MEWIESALKCLEIMGFSANQQIKMKLLEPAIKYFGMMGISADQSLINVKFFMVVIAYATNSGFKLLFIMYEVNSFREFITVFLFISTTCLIAVCSAIIAFHKSHFFEMYNCAEKQIEMRMENPALRAMYERINRLNEIFSKIEFFFLFKISPICFILPKAVIVFSIYLTTDLGNDAFVLPLPDWIPFDWRNPVGYLIALTIEYIYTAYIFLFVAAVFSVGAGAFLLLNAVVTDIKVCLKILNENAKIKGNRMQNVIGPLYDFIDMHSFLHQIFKEFFDLINLMSMLFFTWCLVIVCISLLLFQMEMSKAEIDFVALLITLAQCIYVFCAIGIGCELGQRTSDNFIKINDAIDEFDWHLYPIEIKRMLPIILIVAQKPKYIELFGSTAASRETFTKVMKGGYSYFSVLGNFMK